MAEIEKPDTPTNVVDDIPDNIQKLIDEGKVIKTKTSSGAFRLANQDTLVIDKSNVTSKEYKELKNFADEFEYMLIKPYKADNQTSGVKTNNFDVMKNEYFNYNTTEIEKLYSDDYYLATYTPHQDQVKDLLKDIYDEYSQYFDKRFELEMYPYKGTEFTDGKSVMLLKKIYIKPEFQGQGIGSEIINKITKFADELNIPIMLSTDPGQKLAETLPDYYARFGFLDTGDVEAHTGNRERWLIRQPGELAGKIVEYGEVADDFKTYEEALQAARNTDKPLYSDYIIKQITDRGQTVPGLDTPTNVVDDFKLSGTMGGNTTPTGVNIAYANVEDLEQFIQFDRKAEGNVERINEIKKTILDKGYLYDTAYEGGVVFGVTVDELGNLQIEEGNHRLQALIDVAKETGQEIYVPINPILTSTSSGNKIQLTNSDNAYNSMKQLLTDMLEDNKNFDLDMTINEKLGEPGRKIVELESYTYPGGAPGTSTTQSNIKKFFNSIGLNTITYDELPDNNIYKTGVNTFTDTPTNIIDDKLSTFDTTLNSADGNVEFYIKHQGTQVSANDIGYNPNLGSDTEKFIPGFYGEPVGDVSAKTMGIKIQDNPVSNYYKVQVNTNNLLITQPDGFLGNQIDKVDWNIFAKETGISLSDIKNPKTQNVNSLINELKQLGLDDGTIAEGFRKSGIEGFVELKGDWREVVLIDPNDDLGIGSKLNIEDATEVEFLNNQSKVNQIDELVIKPTNVVDDVIQPTLVDDAIELVDNLNIDNVVKKEITEKLAKVGGQAAGQIPIPGIGQAIDFWETAVLVAGAALLAAGEVDELPKVVQNFGIDLYNGFLSSLNIPFTPVEKVEYTPNTDRIIKGLDIIDKLQPTSYAINPVIEEFQEIEATTPTMELPGFGTVPASKYYQPPLESTPERDNINSIMTNLMTNISNAQGAYPITASELSNFQRKPIQIVPSNSADKPEKVEYDSKEKQNLHDIYANMFTSLSESMMR